MQNQLRCLAIIISYCVVASSWARAETFSLKNGKLIEGTVIRAIGNTVTIKLENGGMYQCPLSEVTWARLVDRRGETIQGALEGWSNGAYFLRSNRDAMITKDGQVIKDTVLHRRSLATVLPKSKPARR